MKVSALIESYKTDEASAFGKLRYRVRQNYSGLLRHIDRDLGHYEVHDIHTRDIVLKHQDWQKRGTFMSHALVSMLRTVLAFGATTLEDDECLKLRDRMKLMRFAMGKPRSSRITAAQVIAIRARAHEHGLDALALAQAFQFDCFFRQRDVIGEYVPISEPGDSDIIDGGFKWLRGIRWEEIDSDMVLRHITSKKLKEVEFDLKLAPMVLEELRRHFLVIERQHLPESGPIIVNEATGLPYAAHTFREQWRMLARELGYPDTLKNMDSRSGAATEATEMGMSLELLRHAMTHSEVATTARYSRGSAEKIAEVMRLRAEHRKAV